MPTYPETVAKLEGIVRGRVRDQTMLCLIIDSPWLPGYVGVDTLDFLFDPSTWLAAYERAHRDLPGVAFVPDVWVELGMAAEPSGWGAALQWHHDSPPSIRGFPGGMEGFLEAPAPDPETDGLMPVILRQYERMKPTLASKGMGPRFAAARGPLAVAAHLLGVTELLMATQLQAERCLEVAERTTELIIRWLRCQLDRMDDPLGVLVLDDVVGMMGPADAARFGIPFLRQIFDAFPGLIHIFHNDTPNAAVFEGLSTIGMDVFNFSHEIDVVKTRSLVGPDVVLMGNIPPLDVLVRGTEEESRQATRQLLAKMKEAGPILVSPGGGVSPGTRIENLQAVLDEVKGWAG
jgi:uroporphyrinogen decarboxylase